MYECAMCTVSNSIARAAMLRVCAGAFDYNIKYLNITHFHNTAVSVTHIL